MPNALKYYRQRQNLSQAELAKIIGIHRPTLSYIEQGIVIPCHELKQKIARALKCLIIDLWKEEEK